MRAPCATADHRGPQTAPRPWRRRGPPTRLAWIDDTRPGGVTVGFARRVPSYKRLTLMLRDRNASPRSCATGTPHPSRPKPTR